MTQDLRDLGTTLSPALILAWARCRDYVEHTHNAEFEAHDVHVRGNELNALVDKFFLVQTYSSNKRTVYAIAEHPGEAPAWLRSEVDLGEYTPPPPVVPDNLFDAIYGLEEIKALILGAMQSRVRVHHLLIGPPAGAKTMFLDAIATLPRVMTMQGGNVTRAGVNNLLLGNEPDWILLDECDFLTDETWAPFLEWMERSTLTVRNGNVSQQVHRQGVLFATTNEPWKIRPGIMSRFSKWTLPAYTKAEFLPVVNHVLVMQEECTPELANYIAAWSWAYNLRDVRETRTIARLCRDPKAVRAYLDSKYRYRPERDAELPRKGRR